MRRNRKNSIIKALFALSLIAAAALGFFVAGTLIVPGGDIDEPQDDPVIDAPESTETPPEPVEESPTPAGTPPTIASDPPWTPSPTPTPTPPPRDSEIEELTQLLEDFFTQQNLLPESKWAVYAMDVESGNYAYVRDGKNEDEPTRSASLIKLFIAGAVFQEALDDAQSPEDLPDNEILTIDDARLGRLEVMLRDSNNQAANELIGALGGGNTQAGMDKVNEFARSIGCTDTELNRTLGVAEVTGTDNHTTVRDCAVVLRMIAAGEFVSGEASESIYSWLKAASVASPNKTSKICAGITGAEIANKTGEHFSPFFIENDAAIVTTRDARYVLCIMSNPTNSDSAKAVFRDIAALVHGYFNGQQT